MSVGSVQAVGTISTVCEEAGFHILRLTKKNRLGLLFFLWGVVSGETPFCLTGNECVCFVMLLSTTGHIYSRSAQEKENCFPLRCIFDFPGQQY